MGVRGVDLPLDLELLLLPGREDAVEQLLGDFGRQDRQAFEARELATHPYRRRRADGEVEVGGTERDHRFEQVVDRAHRRSGKGGDPVHAVDYRHRPGVT